MTEALTDLLRARLAPLQLLQRLEGLVRPYQTQAPAGPEGELRPVRLPVPVRFTPADCQRDERYLVPDEATAGIGFFEDHGGTVPTAAPAPGARPGFRSQVRLVVWLNPAFFAAPLVDTDLLALLTTALSTPAENEPTGDFRQLQLSYAFPPGDEALLSRYSALQQSPLLYAPYRLLGIDITAAYRYSLTCAPALPERLTTPTLC